MAAAEGGMPDNRDWGLGSMGGGGGRFRGLLGELMGELPDVIGDGAALIDRPEKRD